MTDKKKECDYCNESVDLQKQKIVSITTHIPKDEDQTFYYHFECFKKNHDEKIKKKADAIIKNMQQQAQGMLQNVMGGINLGGMGAMFNNSLGQNKFAIDTQEIIDEVKKEDEKKHQKNNSKINDKEKDGKRETKRKQKT